MIFVYLRNIALLIEVYTARKCLVICAGGITLRKRGKLAYIREILQSYPEIKNKQIKTEQEEGRVKVVETALETVAKMKYANSRLKIIKMVYFDRSHTLCGAALQIPVSERMAFKWNSELMDIISEEMHLL